MVVTADGDTLYPGVEEEAVDPTGAGDCFLGGLAARLSEGVSLAGGGGICEQGSVGVGAEDGGELVDSVSG